MRLVGAAVRRLGVGALVAVGGAVACNAVLGVSDVPEPADAATADHVVDSGGAVEAMAPAVVADGGDASTVEASPCGDTMSSASNCGRCGHDCLGGRCSAGDCQAFALVGADAGVTPYGLAQDDSFLYWTDNNNDTITRTDKTTGKSVILYQSADYPLSVAVEDGGIYWGDVTGVWRCPSVGCALGTTQLAVSVAYDMALDDVALYWTDGFGIYSVLKDGLSPDASTLFMGGQSGEGTPTNLVTDGRRIFFTNTDGLLRAIAVDGSAPLSMGSIDPLGSVGLALAGGPDGDVYWSELDPAQGFIASAPIASLEPIAAASGLVYPGPLATDGTSVYWLAPLATDAGTRNAVLGCTLGSCVPTVVASGFLAGVAIVVDAQAVYFTDNGSAGLNGAVWKLAR
jgi:hypothetical protein